MLKIIVRCSLFCALAWFSLPTLQAQPCLKQVFNRYCLGGSATGLAADILATARSDGDAVHYHDDLEGQPIVLIARAQRIVSVSRLQPPGDWLHYTRWRSKLTRIYGRGESLGHFPDYATSRSSRLNALNSGKGFAKMRWDQPGWHIELLWDHRDYLTLRYALAPGDAGETSSIDEGL